MSEPRPQLIGLPTRLRLIEPIGRGASSSVWRARDTRDGVDLAVKIVSVAAGSGPAADPGLLAERAEREVRAMSRLRGLAGVVSLHQVGRTADGRVWMVMDLAAGGSLRARLVDGATLTAPEMTSSAVTLATALANAHDLGVVHGDISPANVLHGADGSAMLADFGMALLLGGGDGAAGVAGFTPAYAAPERLRGAAPSGPSDVFALAATLWHAAFGSAPTRAAVDDLAELAPVLAHAMAVTPSGRPDAVAFARALGAADADLPAVAPPDRARRLPRPRRYRRPDVEQ